MNRDSTSAIHNRMTLILGVIVLRKAIIELMKQEGCIKVDSEKERGCASGPEGCCCIRAYLMV